jgi:hypothetical protein
MANEYADAFIEDEESTPVPETKPRHKEDDKMDKAEFKSIVHGMITKAVQFVDGELSTERAKATDYYFGRPFGNEEPGRSQFVSTDVRDAIQQVIPAVMRAVFGSERIVEFEPQSAEDVAGAEQATEKVYSIFAKENPGFLNTLAVLKDGMVRKTGIFKWWWDDSSTTTNHKFENVDQEQVELLAADPELKLTRMEPSGQSADGKPLFTVEVTRTIKDGTARYEPVPPEEFIYTRDERNIERASGLWHRTRKTRGELIAMGIKAKVIDEHGGDDPAVRDNEEAQARQPDQISTDGEEEGGKANDKHLYVEGFARIDFDGDGVAELRKVCTLGPGYHPVANEPAEDVNFAIFVPDPEPHSMSGGSWADRTMDIQKYKSMLMRGLSDSLAASIFPRMVFKSGDANLADIMNPAMGAPIRTQSGPEAVKELFHNFPGKEVLPVVNLADQILDRRIGQQHGAAGLDEGALQSSTKSAVAAQVTASQATQELLVRIFAESALKPLFKGLYKLLLKHQPRASMMRLRNEWVAVDPRTWNADMDVTVNIVMGSGQLQEKIETLMWIAEQQKMFMETAGPHNPVSGLKEYRDTLAEIVELRGRKNSSRYFKPITDEQIKQMQQEAANAPPPESPEMFMAKTQMEIKKMETQAKLEMDQQRAQRELMMKQAEMAMEWKRIKLEDDRERDRQAADIQLKIRELELKHAVNIQEVQLTAEIERERAASQAAPAE